MFSLSNHAPPFGVRLLIVLRERSRLQMLGVNALAHVA
jgi:hypothetical protein